MIVTIIIVHTLLICLCGFRLFLANTLVKPAMAIQLSVQHQSLTLFLPICGLPMRIYLIKLRSML